MDPIFSETHTTLELATKGSDVDSESSSVESAADGVGSSLESSSFGFHDGDCESNNDNQSTGSMSTISMSGFERVSVENDTEDDDSPKGMKVAPSHMHVISRRHKAKSQSQSKS